MLSQYHHRRCIAYHEAGHAVVAHILGAEVERIVINRRRGGVDGFDGWVNIGAVPGGAIDEVTICLAGKVAEFKAGYRSSGSAESTDLKRARHCLGAHVALKPVLDRRTEAIVDNHRHHIRKLAAVLQRRRCLEADDFKDLMYELRVGRAPLPDVMIPDDADEETWPLCYDAVYRGYRSPPPDRVTLPNDTDTKTRLLICGLIYPDPCKPVSAEWVQSTVESLCPEFTATEAATLLRYIADHLKTALHNPYRSTRNSVIRDVELIESLAIAADRYRRRADDDGDELTRPKRPSRMAFRYKIRTRAEFRTDNWQKGD